MRETKLIIVSGRKRIGKSNETLRFLLREYTKGSHPRKVLIYDPNNEYGSYELYEGTKKSIVKIPMLGHDDILKFNKQNLVEMRRIVPIDKYGKPLSGEEQDKLIVKCMTEFRGGCLWVEDLNVVFGDTLPKRVTGFFTNNAHRDCDIILQLQSISRILPKMWSNCNSVRMHKQLDSADQSKNKLKDNYELFKIAQILVNEEYDKGNIRFFVWIDMDDHKIRGAYSLAQYKMAVREYISENPVQIKREMSKMNFGGNNYTQDDALQSLTNRLIKEFYGN